MSTNPPATLGKYQIIREIARSNDIVYEAYDPLMNRRVALKELAVPPGASGQQREDRVKRFLREARAAGSLAHKNIMTVHEVGEEVGRYFIAMEYLDGKTLRHEIDSKGFIEVERAVEIAKEVLEGLEYAHSKGVIHRDIKPDNIQLLSNGEIKITDFGIARLTFEPNLTMDGQVFGTPSYMSPEQVVGRELDARSDLFSVGAVLYEMLAGVKPFTGDSVVTISYQIMNKTPDRPQQAPFALWQVIEQALDKSPQLRFRDAGEFIRALDLATAASQNVVPDPPPVLGQPYPYVQPPAYSYNPYDPAQQQSIYTYSPAAPPQSGQVPAPTQVPIYYPPPRQRAPLLSPRAKAVLAQFLAATVAISMVLGLAYIALDQYARWVDKQSIVVPQSPAEAPAEPGRPAGTEESFTQEARANPADPAPYRNLGDLLLERADETADANTALDLYRRAGQSLATAASLEPDQATRERTSRRAARAYFEMAQLYADARRNSDAREALYRARTLGRNDPELFARIERLRAEVSGL